MRDTLDRESATPLYVQLSDMLREEIEAGHWRPDRKVPSENELHRTYGISRMTARQVLAQLVNEGLLYRVQGKGTFVAPRKIGTRALAYAGIREQLEEMGYATKTTLVSSEVIPSGRSVAGRLGIAEGTEVGLIRRLRHADGVPISLHESYVPVGLAPNLSAHDLVNEQLCVVLGHHYGLTMGQVDESLEITTASRELSDLLDVRIGAALLQLRQIVGTREGAVFEYSRITFRGDKVRLHFHYDL